MKLIYNSVQKIKTMDTKSNNIMSLANQLSIIEKEMKIIIENSNSMKKIVFYNGSGEKGQLNIWKNLEEPLTDFLINHLKTQKKLLYNKISVETQEISTIEQEIISEISQQHQKQVQEELNSFLIGPENNSQLTGFFKTPDLKE